MASFCGEIIREPARNRVAGPAGWICATHVILHETSTCSRVAVWLTGQWLIHFAVSLQC
jgi:hypothetical protein